MAECQKRQAAFRVERYASDPIPESERTRHVRSLHGRRFLSRRSGRLCRQLEQVAGHADPNDMRAWLFDLVEALKGSHGVGGRSSKTKHQPGEATTANAMPAGSTQVTVTLGPADGGTRVTLRHDDLPNTELREGHQIAWETYLPRLVIAASGGDPGLDPHS